MGFETILSKEYVQRYEKQWPNKTIIDCLKEAIQDFPEKIEIIDRKSRYTYRELGELVDRTALGLLELGLKKVMSSLFNSLTGMNLSFYTYQLLE